MVIQTETWKKLSKELAGEDSEFQKKSLPVCLMVPSKIQDRRGDCFPI